MTNKYVLTITRDYVQDWGVMEALRELLQNCIDGNSDGFDSYITYEDDDLVIKNIGASLEVSTLALGSSSKRTGDFIGKYGEGYKLALVVLLRENFDIEIHNNGELWEPSFEYSDDFGADLLTITKSSGGDNGGLSFIIRDINEECINKAKQEFLVLREHLDDVVFENVIETEFGTILLDDEFKGKIYVEGLFVQDDKAFTYGYNFNNSFVNLDRDRKAIGLYDLKRLTAKSWLTSSDNFKAFHDLISKASSDVNYVKNCMSYADEDFVDGYRRYYNLVNEEKLSSHAGKRIIYTENTKFANYINNQEHEDEEELEVFAVIERKDVSDLLNRGNNTDELIDEIEEKYDSLTKTEQYLEDFNGSDYKILLNWIEERFKDGALTQSEIDSLLTITDDMRTLGFDDIKQSIESNYSFDL